MGANPLAVPPEWLGPVTLRVIGEGDGYAHSRVAIRGHAVDFDEPPERDGTDRGPAPTEMFLATLIGVTNVIVRRCARRDGVAVTALAVEVEGVLDRRGVWLSEAIAHPWTAITVRVVIDTPADDARLAAWRDDVARFSPLHALLEAAGTRVSQSWTRA